jgi:hypothetical protein
MAKSSPEKLAAALRANLLRRKKGPAAKGAKPAAPAPQKGPDKSPKNSA